MFFLTILIAMILAGQQMCSLVAKRLSIQETDRWGVASSGKVGHVCVCVCFLAVLDYWSWICFVGDFLRILPWDSSPCCTSMISPSLATGILCSEKIPDVNPNDRFKILETSLNACQKQEGILSFYAKTKIYCIFVHVQYLEKSQILAGCCDLLNIWAVITLSFVV